MTEYELRIRKDENAATAEIVKVEDGVNTVAARVSTISTSPVAILRFDSAKNKPLFPSAPSSSTKSKLGRLKPSRLSIKLGIVEAQWDIKNESEQRTKSNERNESVKVILKGVFGPLRSLNQAFASENAHPGMKTFLDSFRFYKDEVLGSQHDMEELAPIIYLDLVELIDVIEKETYGSWDLNPSLVDNPKLKPLIKRLETKVGKWLSEHR